MWVVCTYKRHDLTALHMQYVLYVLYVHVIKAQLKI